MSAIIPFELESLAQAPRYQSWIYETVAPFLGNRIFEVGAGIGNMSRWLPVRESLVVTESEQSFIPQLQKAVQQKGPRAEVGVVDLNRDWIGAFENRKFDTVVSFNLMEHILDDRAAFQNFFRLLKNTPGKKRIVTFVPAHQWAFGELDRVFQHHRRYSAADFKNIQKEIFPQAHLEFQYFNLLGLPGWILFGQILKRQHISRSSIQTFEALCPWVKPVDNFIHRQLRLPLGQSLLAVFTFE